MTAELRNDETWTIDFSRRATYRETPGSSSHLGNADYAPLSYPAQVIQEDSLSLQLTSFLNASRSRAIPQVTPEDGHAALELVQQIRQRILGKSQ